MIPLIKNMEIETSYNFYRLGKFKTNRKYIQDSKKIRQKTCAALLR